MRAYLSSVSEVWSIACSAQDLNGYGFCSFCSFQVLLLQFQIQDFEKLAICEVLKAKCIFNGKP